MENFIFSLNVTIPIFLVMALGWALRQAGILDGGFVAVANKFNFQVTLPCLLFRDISSVDIQAVFDLQYVLFCAAASSACFWVIWGGTKLFLKDKSMAGAFVQASFRSSAAVMGLAFIQNIYGQSAMGPLMIVGAVPLYNIYSVVVLTFEGRQGQGGRKIKEAFWNILKNPFIISIFLGLTVSYFHIHLPVAANKTIYNVSQMATPLALVTLGAGFEGKGALAKLKPTLAASFLKLVAQPLALLPVAVSMGFTGEKLIGILIMLASPTTPSCYIMAKNMGNDGELTASVVVATTLLASFTLTGWIFLLKAMGYIG